MGHKPPPALQKSPAPEAVKMGPVPIQPRPRYTVRAGITASVGPRTGLNYLSGRTGTLRLRINAMKGCSAGHVVAAALSATAGLLSPAVGQTLKSEIPQASGREPGRSSPPDTTPYVRPVIPEDCMQTPLPNQGGADAGATLKQHSGPVSKPTEVSRLPQPTPGANCGQ
jgi:hypothetical protein